MEKGPAQPRLDYKTYQLIYGSGRSGYGLGWSCSQPPLAGVRARPHQVELQHLPVHIRARLGAGQVGLGCSTPQQLLELWTIQTVNAKARWTMPFWATESTRTHKTLA